MGSSLVRVCSSGQRQGSPTTTRSGSGFKVEDATMESRGAPSRSCLRGSLHLFRTARSKYEASLVLGEPIPAVGPSALETLDPSKLSLSRGAPHSEQVRRPAAAKTQSIRIPGPPEQTRQQS